METGNIFENFGARCFDDRAMRARLPKDVYASVRRIRDEGCRWDPGVAGAVADAMRAWAMEKGATHYTHWFTPMTGASAGKHESFIAGSREGEAILKFSGKGLIMGESDASSLPSGGLRSAFEARGYTTWDPTSPAFVLGATLYIPTAFCGPSGEALDQKTPLLRSMQALNKQTLRVLRALGDTATVRVRPSVGAEQEYFLVDKDLLNERLDLKICGATLAGKRPPKGQELEDHYYGSVSDRVRSFMRELDEELWLIGVPAKTEHKEAAPGQYELASVFADANVALDHNQVTMELMRRVALRHGFACLLHEKPYAGVNGSGKHNNWSLDTIEGVNLLKPGENPVENRPFLLVLCAVLAAVDDCAELLRLSAACPGNDLRLGAAEAPPPVISVYLGDKLTTLLQNLAEGHAYEMGARDHLLTGVKSLPLLRQDDDDRNRTSPFAFTGNKFEFRMLGASQSVGFANTVLSAAVADKLAGFADTLEKLEDPGQLDAAIAKIIHEVWDAHGRVVYNGDNYSEEWQAEAARRGLPHLRGTVDAAAAFVAEKNMAMFERTKVLSRDECHSRCEMLLDSYAKTMRIAASTLLEMARRSILPAACAMLADVAETKARLEKTGRRSDYNDAWCQRLNLGVNACGEAVENLAKALDALNGDDAPAAAEKMRGIVDGEMAALRRQCDELEELVPEARWPMPGYTALLYDL